LHDEPPHEKFRLDNAGLRSKSGVLQLLCQQAT
jgi:hypothetical protein